MKLSKIQLNYPVMLMYNFDPPQFIDYVSISTTRSNKLLVIVPENNNNNNDNH